VALFPEMVAQWNLEVDAGVALPMYEGPRACGHATVLWRSSITLPLDEPDERRFRRGWITPPTGMTTQSAALANPGH
jgi:hypothetical protein